MKSLLYKYASIIERRDLHFFKDMSNKTLVYKELEQMNTEILRDFKLERERITMVRERRDYVRAKLSDIDYLIEKINQVHPEIRQSISKSLTALHLTFSIYL
jgi:hypothetical protein